jgi:hypothetical protein
MYITTYVWRATDSLMWWCIRSAWPRMNWSRVCDAPFVGMSNSSTTPWQDVLVAEVSFLMQGLQRVEPSSKNDCGSHRPQCLQYGFDAHVAHNPTDFGAPPQLWHGTPITDNQLVIWYEYIFLENKSEESVSYILYWLYEKMFWIKIQTHVRWCSCGETRPTRSLLMKKR